MKQMYQSNQRRLEVQIQLWSNTLKETFHQRFRPNAMRFLENWLDMLSQISNTQENVFNELNKTTDKKLYWICTPRLTHFCLAK